MNRKNGEAVFSSVERGTFISRAVIREIEGGNSNTCDVCYMPIKFAAKKHLKWIIANVYEAGVWQDTEYYHPDCYEAAGMPYGEAAAGQPIMTLEDKLALDGLHSRQR